MKLLLASSDGLTVRVVADSAIGRNSQPWFLPDVGTNWRYRLCPAVKIARLGKNIRPQYASRYVAEQTLLWVADADGCCDLDFMDGAVVAGKWLPAEPLSGPWPELIARLSRLATLKNGDIIALDEPEAASHPIVAPSRIAEELNNIPVLEFNIR